MKRSSLLLCSSLVAMSVSLAGCGVQTNDGKDVGTEIISSVENTESDSSEESTESSSGVDSSESETPELDTEFTAEKFTAFQDYMSQFSHVTLIQSMENGYTGIGGYANVEYRVEVDTKNNITECATNITIDDTETKQVGNATYIREYNEGITYKKQEDGSYERVEGSVNMVAWSLEDYNNIWDIWSYLIKSYNTPIGTMGYTSGIYEYYTVEEPATDDMLTGLEYKELGTQTVDYIYYNYDGAYYPESIIINITYTDAEDTEYYVKSVMHFDMPDNEAMIMPKE